MKKYILLAIAALSFTSQSIQCANITDIIRQMWQWDHKFAACEFLNDLDQEIMRLTAEGAPACEIIPLKKAAAALEADQAESSRDMINAILRSPPESKFTWFKSRWIQTTVGAMAGLGLAGTGLKSIYGAYQRQALLRVIRTLPQVPPAA